MLSAASKWCLIVCPCLCILYTITKVFPTMFRHTLTIATEHNATPTNQSTSQVLLSNPEAEVTQETGVATHSTNRQLTLDPFKIRLPVKCTIPRSSISSLMSGCCLTFSTFQVQRSGAWSTALTVCVSLCPELYEVLQRDAMVRNAQAGKN